MLFALTMVPLIVGAGMATDFARIQILKSSLQTIADSAALAGASEMNQHSDESVSQLSAQKIATAYFNKGYAALTDNGTLTTLSVPLPTDSITVTVSATVTLNMTLMSLFTSTQTINVFAKALGAGYVLKIVPDPNFGAGAADANTIFYYIVPPGGGHPPVQIIPSILTALFTLPNFPGYTPLFSNKPLYRATYNLTNSTAYIPVGPNDKIGFALFNVTGGITQYGLPLVFDNAYDLGLQFSPHWFFSSLAAPSMDPLTHLVTLLQPTYNILSKNCSKTANTAITVTTSTNLTQANDTTCHVGYPCVTVVGTVPYQNNLMITNPAVSPTPACSTPASGTLSSCLHTDNAPTSFNWGDMGGNLGKSLLNLQTAQDDFDYANADYTIQCVPDTIGTASNVILVQ